MEMVEKNKGAIMVLILVFVFLSGLIVSQVAGHLINNKKLLFGIRQQVDLEFVQYRLDELIDYWIRNDVSWQWLESLKASNGTLSLGSQFNFTLLPTCSELVESNWVIANLLSFQNSTVFLKILSPISNREGQECLAVLLISCSYHSMTNLGIRSMKVYEFGRDETQALVSSEIKIAPRRLL